MPLNVILKFVLCNCTDDIILMEHIITSLLLFILFHCYTYVGVGVGVWVKVGLEGKASALYAGDHGSRIQYSVQVKNLSFSFNTIRLFMEDLHTM